jgi:hypothetical protein
MYKTVAIIVFLSAAGLYFAATWGTDRKASCLAEVARLDGSYKKGRAGGALEQELLEEVLPAARRDCEQGEFDDALRVVNTAGLICRLNNGCPVISTR